MAPIYTDQIVTTTGTATAVTALTSYTPQANGSLLRVKIELSGQAATSILETFILQLNCTTFTPNNMYFSAAGGGIRTAPAVPIAAAVHDVNQPVLSQQAIKLNYNWNVTATTPNVTVIGTFSC